MKCPIHLYWTLTSRLSILGCSANTTPAENSVVRCEVMSAELFSSQWTVFIITKTRQWAERRRENMKEAGIRGYRGDTGCYYSSLKVWISEVTTNEQAKVFFNKDEEGLNTNKSAPLPICWYVLSASSSPHVFCIYHSI